MSGNSKSAMRRRSRQRGVALLAVLWLSVALTMIAMTTAYLVRTEAAAVAGHIDAERATFLARGAMQAALYSILHPSSAAAPPSEASLLQPFRPGQRWLRFEFEQGTATVEVVPENAKINVNLAPADQLAALFALLGPSSAEGRELAAAMVDWRSPSASDVATSFDIFYANLPQPYAARHAAFNELEELLAVKGMSRDLYFGQLAETPDRLGNPAWNRTAPLADLLTTEPVYGGVNIHYAAYEVLRVLPGWDDSLAGAVVEARSRVDSGTLVGAVPGLSAAASLSPVTLTPGPAFTLTATAWMKGSPVRHTVRARLRLDRNAPMGFRITGWWDDWPWSGTPPAELDRMGGPRT